MSRRFKSLVDFHQRAEKEYQDTLKRTQARAKPLGIMPLAVLQPHYYVSGSCAKQHAWMQTGFPDMPWDASIEMPPEAWRRRRRTAEDESEPAEGAAKRVRTAAACVSGIHTNRTVEDWAAGAWRELVERIDEALASGVMVGETLVCKSVRRCQSPSSSGMQVRSTEPMDNLLSPSPFLYSQQTQSTTSLALASHPPSSYLPITYSTRNPSHARFGLSPDSSLGLRPASQPRHNSIDLDLIVAELLACPASGSRRGGNGTSRNKVDELRSDRVSDLTRPRSCSCDSRSGHFKPQPPKELETMTRATLINLADSPKSTPHTLKSSLDKLDKSSSRNHSGITRDVWLPQDPQLPAPHHFEPSLQPNRPETSATLIDTEPDPDALMVNGPGWLDDLDPNLPSLGGADLFDEEYSWIKECV